jgi:hypothetical protein
MTHKLETHVYRIGYTGSWLVTVTLGTEIKFLVKNEKRVGGRNDLIILTAFHVIKC